MRKLALALISFSLLLPPSAVAGDAPRAASFWKRLGAGTVQCGLCPRRCVLGKGRRGVCGARVNDGGTLYTLSYGNPVALHSDPIEKKPFFHVLPGTASFSLATAGCNMRCLFCQNWQISQSRPDEASRDYVSPEEIAAMAARAGATSVAFTYTEPTVFYEYMLDCAKAAKKRGLATVIHSCGYINEEPLAELLGYIDAVNVDLKGFDEGFYRRMTRFAGLQPVLEAMKRIKGAGVWLELTCLIVPGQNDDAKKVRQMCAWIRENLGADVPVHFSRFMPAFKLKELPPTPLEKLEECAAIAEDEGLHYVYIGNVPGHPRENTYCPQCKAVVVARTGYKVHRVDIKNGMCAHCSCPIAGLWEYKKSRTPWINSRRVRKYETIPVHWKLFCQ